MGCPVIPPDSEAVKELMAFAKAIYPRFKRAGLEAYCQADLWLKSAELRKAIREGEELILDWPDGTVTLHYALSLAILEPIPTPKAQQGAQFFRHKLKSPWAGN